MARLVIESPGQQRMLYEVVKTPLRVGRAPENDLVIKDVNVSRFHAVLELTPDGYRLVDRQSRNGIRVGERRCAEIMLQTGQSVRLGDTLLRFEDSGAGWSKTTIFERPPVTLVESGEQDSLAELNSAFRQIPYTLPTTVNELQKELSEARRRALLFEMVSRTRRLLHAAGPEEALAKVPQLIFSAIRAERVLVLVWDQQKQCLAPAVIHSAPGISPADTEVGLSQTLLNKVLQSRQAVLVRDARADPQLVTRESVVLSGLRSAICAPMAVHDRLHGLIYADNCRLPLMFDEDDLELLSILALETALVLDSAQVLQERQKQESIRAAYRRFLPEHVTDQLLANPDAVQLGGARQDVTALFADLRGFTSLAETLPPEQAVELLNTFFTEMAGIIFRHNGTLDKYLGDGLLAVFGAPLSSPQDARRAVECAVEMQLTLDEITVEWKRQGRPVIPMGIGVNSGEAIAGNIGSPQHMEYTVIGDTVNVAARLTANAGPGEILLGESTWQQIHNELPTEPLPPLQLKGKREPSRVYRVVRDRRL